MSTTPTPSVVSDEKAHLENFDDLDFNVFSGQKWDQLGNSHAQNIIVHWFLMAGQPPASTCISRI